MKNSPKYDFNKWNIDLSSAVIENKDLLKTLIGLGMDIEKVRQILTGMLRTPTSWKQCDPSPRLMEVRKGYSYGIRYLKMFLNIKPDSLIKDSERDVIESILRRFEKMNSLTEDRNTAHKRILKQIGIDPRLKTDNQRIGMIVYQLFEYMKTFIPGQFESVYRHSQEDSFFQKDVFSLIAELLNLTNPAINPMHIYDSAQVQNLYYNILQYVD